MHTITVAPGKLAFAKVEKFEKQMKIKKKKV